MRYIFSNNAISTLVTAIGGADVSLTLVSGTNFPNPTEGEEKFDILVEDGAKREYMECTLRASDVLTVTRTGSNSFPAGSIVKHILTAEALNSFMVAGAEREHAGDPDGLAALYHGEEVYDTENDVWYKHTEGTTWKIMDGGA